MRVGVVGGGAAGLCAIKHSVAFGCEVIAFEQSDKTGGTWVYTDDTGNDKFGNAIHSSMYKGLHTNLPKELMSFPDLLFPPHEKSYVPARVVDDYLKLYADTFKLLQYIKFANCVTRVRPLLDDKWEVTAKDLLTGSYSTYIFDVVFICNGHFSEPSIPTFQRRDEFKGGQSHSHVYRKPEKFRNKKVLVIGGGPSGIDISQELAGHAQVVYWSNHINPPKVLDIANLIQKPDVNQFTPEGATFADGSSEAFDEVIFCTGYNYTFPFLSTDCEITCDVNYIRPLFKHCININKPTMGIIGLPFNVCPFQMFDLQIKFCLTFMTGKKLLPTKKEMLRDTERDMNERWQRGLAKRKAHSMGLGVQDAYFADLASTAGIQPVKPIVLMMYKASRDHKNLHPTKYRNFIFTVVDDNNYEAIMRD